MTMMLMNTGLNDRGVHASVCADAIAYIVYAVLCIGFKMIYIKQQSTIDYVVNHYTEF